MNRKPEIDETLGLLGSVEPPTGMEQRIQQRLRMAPPRPFFSRIRIISSSALAASVALSAAVLNPRVRQFVLHPAGSVQTEPFRGPQVVAPTPGGFGSASAMRVPVEPVAVPPSPVTQGRGRSRSGRAVLPNGNLAPLPRGVAAPRSLVPAMAAAGH
jgi:hypothetical protein